MTVVDPGRKFLRAIPRSSKFIDMSGKKVGRLKVLYPVSLTPTYYLCRCSCGKRTIVFQGNLHSEKTTSCGCYNRDVLREIKRAEKLLYVPTYSGLHRRLKDTLGSANDHVCVDCGGQACDWSYVHGDPEELVSDFGMPYSLDLNNYEPRCRTCHNIYDKRYGQHKPFKAQR